MMRIDDVYIDRAGAGLWCASSMVGGYRIHVRFDRKPTVSRAREAIRSRYWEVRAGY